jgi:hypothetical protein
MDQTGRRGKAFKSANQHPKDATLRSEVTGTRLEVMVAIL